MVPISELKSKVSCSQFPLVSVVIYDMLGKEVLRSEHVQSQLDISVLKPGMYLLNFIQGINTQTKKLLVH